MKKTLSIILTIALFLCFLGCKQNNNTKKSEEIKINMPTDNSVNGYRIKNNSTDLPSTILGSQVVAGNVTTNDSSSAYCANKNSKVFHYSNCTSVKNIKKENCVYFTTREDCTTNGYTPCKRCNP